MAELQRTINKILVAVDGSESGYRAARTAIVIARGVLAKIIAVNVVQESPISKVSPEFMTVPQQTFAKMEEEAKGFVQKVVDLCRESRVDAESKVVWGSSVVDTICQTASEEQCDLIAMGTRGTTGVKRFLLGSVASGVITYAPCPVLVVR